MKIQLPGKTFILGEYAVLQGGAALIACTEPCFTFTATPVEKSSSIKTEPENHPFHPDSPAGKLIQDYPEPFQSYRFTWKSPYLQGGFGGSTAEFLACYRWIKQRCSEPLDLEILYETYLRYAYQGIGIPPSGADLIAQTQEGMVYIGTDNLRFKPLILNWSLSECELLIFKTPYKLATHEYLASLANLPEVSVLSALTTQGYEALRDSHAQKFIHAINDYAENLAQLKLTAEPTQALLKQLKKHSACLAAKGCGALGADVIAVVVDIEKKADFIEKCKSQKLVSATVVCK
jgi:mevalonate kinase